MESRQISPERRYLGRSPTWKRSGGSALQGCSAQRISRIKNNEELRELTYQELTPERWHAVEDLIVREQIIQRGYSEVYEKEYRKKDGTIIPVELRTILSRDAAGQPSSMWGIVREITDRKQAEEALRRSEQRYKSLHAELEVRVRERTAELERTNQELQQFSFVASHDLNEPLRKIQTFGSLLKEKSGDLLSAQQRDYISRMTGAADRMRELLDALLRYSRLETKGQDFRPVRLDDIVREAVSDLEVTIGKIGAHVKIGPLPSVSGDPLQLRQLFQNLVSNSLKYYRSEVTPFVGVHQEETDGVCRILVEDHGIGFDEKYLEKIFQPFQRLHGRNEYSGIGMGLAICRKIVERHNGTITAKSTPGKGSTFIVTLPLNGTKSVNKPE